MKKEKALKTSKKESSTIQSTKSSKPPVIEVETPVYSHKDLLRVLYWAWDGFDRSAINFFSIWETAESIKSHKELHGEALYLGVRYLDWTGSSKRVFDAFAGQPIESNDKFDKYLYEGIPMYVYIFAEDVCIRSTDTVLYENENFSIPNPYERFVAIYGNRNN